MPSVPSGMGVTGCTGWTRSAIQPDGPVRGLSRRPERTITDDYSRRHGPQRPTPARHFREPRYEHRGLSRDGNVTRGIKVVSVVAGCSLFNGVLLTADCRITYTEPGGRQHHTDVAQKVFFVAPMTVGVQTLSDH